MRLVFSLVLTAMLYGCDAQVTVDVQIDTPPVDSEPTLTDSALPLTDSALPLVDSFVMRNPEIREDILKQLTLKGVEHWENEDGSIGFNVVDTKQVDQIANEAIGVYISLQ